MPYLTSEMSDILAYVERDMENAEMAQSIHFTTTALSYVRRLLNNGGTIIADTTHVHAAIDMNLLKRAGLRLVCYIDDPAVISMAEKRRVTRAEVSVDQALQLPGLKLFAVGSAPAALNRLVLKCQNQTVHDVGIVATPVGYATAVTMKERVWDSGLPAVLMRGNIGGALAGASLINAILSTMVTR